METFLSNDTIFSSTNIKFPWFYCTNRPSHSCNNLANVAGKSKEIVGKSQATGKQFRNKEKRKLGHVGENYHLEAFGARPLGKCQQYFANIPTLELVRRK